MTQDEIADKRERLEDKLADLKYQEQRVIGELAALRSHCKHPSLLISTKSGESRCGSCGWST